MKINERKNEKYFFYIMSIFMLLTMITGCYNESYTSRIVKMDVVTDNSASTSRLNGYSDTVIPEGSKIKLQAFAVFDDGGFADVSDTVNWTSSDPDIATVDNQGWVTAQIDLPNDNAGFTNITIEKQEITAVHKVNVSSAVIESIQLTPHNIELNKGHSTIIEAEATYTDGSTRFLGSEDDLLWKSSDPDTALVDMYGIVTAKEMGEAEISVSVGNIIGDNIVGVSVLNIALESIKIAPESIVMPQATSQQLTVLGEYSDDTEREIPADTVIWASDDDDTVSVTPYGKIEALKEGQINVYARLKDFEATRNISVTNASIKDIQITSETAVLPVGFETQFQALALYDNGETHDVTTNVTWVSSDELVAQIDSSGFLTAIGNGLTTITARSSNGVLSNSVPISVNSAQLTAINLTPLDIQLPINYQSSIKAEGLFSDGQSFDVSSLVAWHSSTPGIVTIDKGVVTGVAKGETKISVQLDNVSSTVASNITVSDAALERILLTLNAEINMGMSSQLEALGLYSDDSVLDLTDKVQWTTDNESTVTINTTGLATGVSEGTAEIDAALDGITSVIPSEVTVLSSELTNINIASDSGSDNIVAGMSQTYTATGVFSDDSEEELNSTDTSWVTEDHNTAIVIEGKVIGIAEGTTTLTAKKGDITSPGTTITVSEAELLSITVTADESSIDAGLTTKVTAKGHFSDGSEVEPLAPVIWSSEDTSVATVDQNGLITGKTEGNVDITATQGNTSASITIQVTAAQLIEIEINPHSYNGDPANDGLLINTVGYSQLTADRIYSDGTRTTIDTNDVRFFLGNTGSESISLTPNGQIRSLRESYTNRSETAYALDMKNNLSSSGKIFTVKHLNKQGEWERDSLCGRLGQGYDALDSTYCLSVMGVEHNSTVTMAPLSRQLTQYYDLTANGYISGAMPGPGSSNDTATYYSISDASALCDKMNEMKAFGLDSWGNSNKYGFPYLGSYQTLLSSRNLKGYWPTGEYAYNMNTDQSSRAIVSYINDEGSTRTETASGSNPYYVGCSATLYP